MYITDIFVPFIVPVHIRKIVIVNSLFCIIHLHVLANQTTAHMAVLFKLIVLREGLDVYNFLRLSLIMQNLLRQFIYTTNLGRQVMLTFKLDGAFYTLKQF